MNAPVTLTAAVLLAGATSVAVQLALAPSHSAETNEAAAPDPLDSLASELRALRSENEEFRRGLRELRDAGLATTSRLPAQDVEAAVRRVLAEQGELAAISAEQDGTDPLAAPVPVEDLLSELLGLDGHMAAEQFWQRMREEGRTDELIAAFEERAASDPNNPDLQLQLGQAYLAKIQELGDSALAGVMATKADKAFDAALGADPQHYEARFHKAMALSFWPPVFGKQNEAISQFEVLVQQQATMPASPGHAQTHLLLGNMYQQIGQTEKAIAAWQAGLTLFPGHLDLAGQLALVQGSGSGG